MEDSVGFDLSAGLYGAITLKEGIVQETNFDSYTVVRINQVPRVENAYHQVNQLADGHG